MQTPAPRSKTKYHQKYHQILCRSLAKRVRFRCKVRNAWLVFINEVQHLLQVAQQYCSSGQARICFAPIGGALRGGTYVHDNCESICSNTASTCHDSVAGPESRSSHRSAQSTYRISDSYKRSARDSPSDIFDHCNVWWSWSAREFVPVRLLV